MPLTKIKRGGLDTGITDNSDANALTFDSSENATFSGDVYVNGNSSNYDQLTIEGAAASGIRFKDSGGTTDGFVYASSDNIGFLQSNGGWLVKANATSTTFGGDVLLNADNKKVKVGAGGDLEIYHNGSNSLISNSTGNFIINQGHSSGNLEFEIQGSGSYTWDSSPAVFAGSVQVGASTGFGNTTEVLTLKNASTGGTKIAFWNNQGSNARSEIHNNVIDRSSGSYNDSQLLFKTSWDDTLSTVLTLDYDKSATFAGSIVVANTSTDLQATFGANNEALDDPYIRIIGRNTGNSSGYNFDIGMDADVPKGYLSFGGTTALSLDTSGSATFAHDVTVSSSDPTIRIKRSNNSAYAGHLDFTNNVDAVGWQIGVNQNTGAGLEINEGNGLNNRLYIAPGGNATFSGTVLISQSGSETPLHIKNTNTGAGQNCYLTIENDGGADTYLNFLQGSSNGYIKYTDEGDMIFQTACMNDMLSIDSSGATFAGNVVSQGEFVQFGSTDSDTRIIFSSKGGAYSSGSSNAFHNLRGHGTGVILNAGTITDAITFEYAGNPRYAYKSSSGAKNFQTLSGSKTCTQGAWTEIAYITHTYVLEVTAWATTGGNRNRMVIYDLVGSYGGGVTATRRMNNGYGPSAPTVDDLQFAYQNTGGSQNYILRAYVETSDNSTDASVYYTIRGMADGTISNI